MGKRSAESRHAYYLANKDKYRVYAERENVKRRAAAAKRGPVKIGRPPSEVPKKDRKRASRKVQEARRRELFASIGPIYSGTKCKYGHDGRRYTLSSQCVTCQGIRQKVFLAANPSVSKLRSRKWAANNRDRLRQMGRDKYAKNPEKYRAKTLRQVKANPAAQNARVARRSAAKDQRTPKWANLDEIKKVYAECAALRKATGEKYCVDHIIPLRGALVSGLHVRENLQILDNVTNIRKKNHYAVG